MENSAISAWFIREALHLEVKLYLKRDFDNWQFKGNLCFTVAVITTRNSKNDEKNCHFEIYVHGLSEFLDITDVCPYLEFHENWVFQIFAF